MPNDTAETFETQFGVPRCLRCGYVLENLPTNTCPECGQDFDFNDPDSYTLKACFALLKRKLRPGGD